MPWFVKYLLSIITEETGVLFVISFVLTPILAYTLPELIDHKSVTYSISYYWCSPSLIPAILRKSLSTSRASHSCLFRQNVLNTPPFNPGISSKNFLRIS